MSTVGWVRYTRSKSIEHHVALIKEMSDKSVRDPELRQLAVKIVSGSYLWKRNPRTGKEEPYIKAWNSYFRVEPRDVCPPRDDECEVVRLWDFVVSNFRYVYDPSQIDTFATAKMSLEAGGGDCDDATILITALAKAIGFQTRARVIATSDDPKNWVHIYPLIGLPKDNPSQWLPLDCTVTGFKPADEWPDIAQLVDFEMG